MRMVGEEVVVGQGRVEQAEHVVGVLEWARGSFGVHGLGQGRIATIGCRGSTRPERRAFVRRLFP